MTAPWSPARSSLRRRCLRQYLLRYELKANPSQPDDHARMHGRIVHAGLAAAFVARINNERLDDPLKPQMARYYPVAERTMMAHSDYAGLSDVETMQACGEVYRALARIPLPHPSAILGVEMYFKTEVQGEPIAGVVDLVLRTGEDRVHIRDWKSGLVTWQPVTDSALPLYGWVARERWPWAKTITLGLFSTRTGHELVETLGPDDDRSLVGRLVRDARDARADAARLTAESVDALYLPRRGEHCRTCSFRSYCPLFRHVTDLSIRPGVDVVAERERLTQALEQRS
jgi:hypothetical protein